MPMASTYALPVSPPGGSHHYHHHHSHSHSYSPSYSAIQLSPKRERTNSFTGSSRGHAYGQHVRKAPSNGSLYTHAEVSPERGSVPSPLPNLAHDHSPALQQNASTFQSNGHILGPPFAHARQHSTSSMKSRPRGESDLGRPTSTHQPSAGRAAAVPFSWITVPEALTSLLVPLPFLIASAAYSSSQPIGDASAPLSAYEKLQQSVLEESTPIRHQRTRVGLAWIDLCIITSGTLVMVGIMSKMRAFARRSDRKKDKPEKNSRLRDLASLSTLRQAASSSLSVGLPLYASTQIGGARTGLVLLVSHAASMPGQSRFLDAASNDWKHILKSRMYTLAVLSAAVLLDLAGITSSVSSGSAFMGYLALASSVLMLDSPLPKSSIPSGPVVSRTPTVVAQPSWNQFLPVSPLTRTTNDASVTLIAGAATCAGTIFSTLFFNTSWTINLESVIIDFLAIACFATAIFLSRPASLHSRSKAGLGLGCLLTAVYSVVFSPASFRSGTISNCVLALLFFSSVHIDTNSQATHKHHDHNDHDPVHDGAHDHQHPHHSHSDTAEYSLFTRLILNQCAPGSLVHGIVSEKDSRRIAYFTFLNFAFMLVQGVYGYLSGSLGLLSDTVHMFFDCLGLVVGLGAAVASKWPTSPEKPYGWGKLNTLAGFGNGIFLMLVSVEFAWEAVEGILEHRELRHVKELLVVSTLGFLVNMVGLFAFGHAHAGHDHGHGHSHGHSHSHGHDHAHDHAHSHSHSPSHSHDHSHSHSDDHSHTHQHDDHHSHDHSHDHAHGTQCDHKHNDSKGHSHLHDHENENMHGIFLHVAADAGGSLAVILSTALTLWKPWYLWDPLATIIIAVLIFAAAVPLVASSGQKLLLVVPDQLEYSIKNTLQELSELRGVVGYAVPRFWIDDKDSAADDAHGHHHHEHDHHPSSAGREKVMGVIHVIAAQAANLEDVRDRVDHFVRERNMNLVIHVEREGEGHDQCWCSTS